MIDVSVFLLVVVVLSTFSLAGIAFYAIDAHNRVEKLEEKVRELEARK